MERIRPAIECGLAKVIPLPGARTARLIVPLDAPPRLRSVDTEADPGPLARALMALPTEVVH